MPLTMRPTGLGSGFYKDDADYSIYCGKWRIGRIYETRTGPAELRWFWALHFPSKPSELRTDNRAASLEAAKAEFEASWKQWKAWAGMEEAPNPPRSGVLNITLSAHRTLLGPDGVITEQVAVAYLRGNVQAALSLRQAIDNAVLLAAPTGAGKAN